MFAELMGGRVEVESEKNRGSTFSFSIWVERAEEEPETQQSYSVKDLAANAALEASLENDREAIENIRTFGTDENKKNLERNLSKLILCVEMENWEKAEMFMEIIRQLTAEAPPEVKRIALRLKMAIQKEDYEKVCTAFESINEFL